MIKSITIFLLFSLYFSSLNLKYLKLTKMDITRFAMKLFKYTINNLSVQLYNWCNCNSGHQAIAVYINTIIIIFYSFKEL